jgi:hypothetical protein
MSSLKFACTLLVFVSPALASPITQLKGVITDSEGAAIRGAHIFVHWDQSGAKAGLRSNIGLKNDLVLETDTRGEFAAELPPGFYDVFASATAFSPDCRKIRIKSGETMIYKTQLKADPLVIKELGDSPFR